MLACCLPPARRRACRWGDAPEPSLAAAALLPREAVTLLDGVGYQHDAWQHCPQGNGFRANCDCDPKQ